MIKEYRVGEMVFGKCQNYPYWPCKISAYFPNSTSYKVVFIGEKSEATIDQTYILPFTEETYRKISSEPSARTNRGLKHSLNIAIKRFNKLKKGLNTSSEDQDYLQQSELPKKYQDNNKTKTKIVNLKESTDPHYQLGALLHALADQASNHKNTERTFTPEQENRLRELLDPNSGLLLASLIEFRVIERFILTLKQLDLWGLKQYPQLHELHSLVRTSYDHYKSIILSPQFAAIPLRQNKRQFILQKVQQNKAGLHS